MVISEKNTDEILAKKIEGKLLLNSNSFRVNGVECSQNENELIPPLKSIFEGENVIAVTKDEASITLEPGGQFELSGAPLKTIHETCKEINTHLAFTKKLEEKYHIGFLGLLSIFTLVIFAVLSGSLD